MSARRPFGERGPVRELVPARLIDRARAVGDLEQRERRDHLDVAADAGDPAARRAIRPPVYVHDRCWHCEPGFGETGDGCTALKHLGAIDDEIDEKQEELREHEVRAVPAPMRACANHTLPPCHDHRREGRRMPM